MKLSTRARYGLRAMVDLAAQGEGVVRPMKDIAESQGLSLKYLEQLVAFLRAAKLVHPVRGRNGGLELTRPASEIRVGEIVRALEHPFSIADCLDGLHGCPRADGCVTRDVWEAVEKAIDGVLDSISLQDLAERQKRANTVST